MSERNPKEKQDPFLVATGEFNEILRSAKYDGSAIRGAYQKLEMVTAYQFGSPFAFDATEILTRYSFLLVCTTHGEQLSKQNNDLETAEWFGELNKELTDATDAFSMPLMKMKERVQAKYKDN